MLPLLPGNRLSLNFKYAIKTANPPIKAPSRLSFHNGRIFFSLPVGLCSIFHLSPAQPMPH